MPRRIKRGDPLGLSITLAVTNLAVALSVAFYVLILFGAVLLNCRILHTAELFVNLAFLVCSALLWLTYRRWWFTESERKELENVMNSVSPDVLLVVNPAGAVLMCNSTVERMFGYKPEEVIGQNMNSLLYWGTNESKPPGPGGGEPAVKDKFDIADAKGVRKDGELFSVEVIVSRLKGSDGKVLHLRDVTEREQARELLRLSETNFRNAVNANVDGMVIVGKEGTVLLANPAAAVLFGRRQEELQGKSFEFPVPDGSADVEINGPGNHKVTVELRATEITWQREPASLVLLRDVTQRKKADELKNEFIGVVSHELRTPLSIIREGVGLVLEGIPGKINDEQARLLNIARTSANRMTWIANSLLDISRIEAGKMVPEKTDFSFKTLVEQTAALFEAKARDRKLELRLNLPDEELRVVADRNMIGQVLTNLIGNAIKFTKEGFVGIYVEGNSAQNLKCVVSDSGPGIENGDAGRIFDKFQQFGRGVESEDRGAGLGLSIAKSIVELHRGKIWAESENGKGTSVYFTLPRIMDVAAVGN